MGFVKKLSLTYTLLLPFVSFFSKSYVKSVQNVLNIAKYKHKHDSGCTSST